MATLNDHILSAAARLLVVPGDVDIEADLGPAPDVNNHLYTLYKAIRR